MRLLFLSVLSTFFLAVPLYGSPEDPIYISLSQSATPLRPLLQKIHEYIYTDDLPESVLFVQKLCDEGYRAVYKDAVIDALDEIGPILDTLQQNQIVDEEMEKMFLQCCSRIHNPSIEVLPTPEEVAVYQAHEDATREPVLTPPVPTEGQVTIQNLMVQPVVCCSSTAIDTDQESSDGSTQISELEITGNVAGGAHLYCDQEDGFSDATVITYNLRKTGNTMTERKANPYLGAARIRLQGDGSGKIMFDVTEDTVPATIPTERVRIDRQGLHVTGKIYASDGLDGDTSKNSPTVPKTIPTQLQTKILYGLIDNWTAANRFGKPIITTSSGGFKPTEEQNQETGEGYETRATIHFAESFTARPTILPITRSPDLQAVVDTITTEYFTYSIRNVHGGQYNVMRWQVPISMLIIGY